MPATGQTEPEGRDVVGPLKKGVPFVRQPADALPDVPLVSAIISSYNHADYLKQAIESVYDQTYPNMELVIVDDGSTDSSAEIIEETCKDAPTPTSTIIQKNAGQASALNAGFQKTQGQIVALLDCDDYWLPEKIELMVAFMKLLPDGGVYQHQILSEGEPFRVTLPSGDIYREWRKLEVLNLAVRQDLLRINVPTSALLFRRQVLDRIFPIPEALVVFPDFYLFIAGCAHGPLYSHPKPLAYWREHAEKASDNAVFSARNFWFPVVLPTINKRLDEDGIPLRLVFRRRDVLKEPLRLVREAFARRRERRRTGKQMR